MKKTTKSILLAAGAIAALTIPFTIEGDKNTGAMKIIALGYKISKESREGDVKISIPGVNFTICKRGEGRNKSKPLFSSALELAAAKEHISSEYICRKLAVGRACADAFIEMMQEYGVIEAAGDDGNCKVVMSGEDIDKLIKTF